MAFCAQCGAETTGNFCSKCGAAINPGGPQPSFSTAGPGTGATAVEAPGMSDNVAGALCYLVGLITGIIFLVLAPYNQNKTVRFHAFQAIFFHVGAIILWIGSMIIGGMFGFLIGLGLFLTWLYLMYSAYTNKMVVLPVIGPLAQKQA